MQILIDANLLFKVGIKQRAIVCVCNPLLRMPVYSRPMLGTECFGGLEVHQYLR